MAKDAPVHCPLADGMRWNMHGVHRRGYAPSSPRSGGDLLFGSRLTL